MDISSNNISNLATWTFLTNPLYTRELSKNINKITNNDLEEKKFYKKRLNMIHKQLMHGEIIDKDVQRVHDEFIKVSINYLKMIDKKDILQQEYEGQNHETNKPDFHFDLDTENKQIMKTNEPDSTLDNFVTSKVVNYKPPIPPPKQKNINLKDEKLRNKGVKKKKKIKKNENKDNVV